MMLQTLKISQSKPIMQHKIRPKWAENLKRPQAKAPAPYVACSSGKIQGKKHGLSFCEEPQWQDPWLWPWFLVHAPGERSQARPQPIVYNHKARTIVRPVGASPGSGPQPIV